MMIAFILIFLLNTKALPRLIRPNFIRRFALLLAFSFFAYFVTQTIKGAL